MDSLKLEFNQPNFIISIISFCSVKTPWTVMMNTGNTDRLIQSAIL